MVFQVISFLGLVIGMILINNFKKELKDIKTFLNIINFIILFIIILYLLYLAKINLLLIIGVILGIIGSYFINIYFYYGLMLTLASFMDNSNKILFGILIFILGLIYPAVNKVDKKKVILILIIFILPFVLLLTDLTLKYNNFISGFIIGGIIIGLTRYNKQVKK